MKISNSKKQLAKIISENGGWRDGAKFSSQDKDGDVNFFAGKPKIRSGWTAWSMEFVRPKSIYGQDAVKNWHQTVISREEYFHLHPAHDADGWIEWNGGECPVDDDCKVSIRVRGESGSARGKAKNWSWGHSGDGSDIIAYRLHKPEQANPEFCESVTRSIPGPKPTIEQLAADYRNRKEYADRKQAEADAAKADADVALYNLELAGEAIGLIVTPVRVEKEQELVITDWRDLLAGDEIEYLSGGIKKLIGKKCVVTGFDYASADQNVKCFYEDESSAETGWPMKWRFIRRP